MKKIASAGVEVLGHKVKFNFSLSPSSRIALKKRDEKIVREYRRDCSIGRLAKKYGLTQNRISQILLAGGARKPKWRKMSDEKKGTIFQLERKGFSKAEIGRQVGISRERVRQILDKG